MIPLVRLEPEVRSLAVKYQTDARAQRMRLAKELKNGGAVTKLMAEIYRLQIAEKRLGNSATLAALVRIGLRYAKEHPEEMLELILAEDMARGRPSQTTYKEVADASAAIPEEDPALVKTREQADREKAAALAKHHEEVKNIKLYGSKVRPK
jgi:hypothetical protein